MKPTSRKQVVAARLYLVAPARIGIGPLAPLVPELVDAGVDLIQLREKELEADAVLAAAEPLAAACKQAGVPFIVNDRPDIALAASADGVHLGTEDGPTAMARRILGPDAIVGRSTHSEADLSHALELEDPDYVAVGPVHPTPTKPGRPAPGLPLVRHAATALEIPWFAIGGIDENTLASVMSAGARRIVVVRAITEASDPVAAAARLKEMLLTEPL